MGAVGVLLDLPTDWPSSGLGDAGVIASQLPPPAALLPGQLLVVMPRGAPTKPWLGRLLGSPPWAAGAVRGAALLATGYVDLGAGVDPQSRLDLVWARAPGVTPPAEGAGRETTP